HLMVSATDVVITVAGQSLGGSFEFQQQTLPDGSRVLTVNVTATMSFAGMADVALSGSLLVTNAGVAGALEITSQLPFGAGVTLGGTFPLKLNSATTPVVLNDTAHTRLPAGRYLRIEGDDITLTIGTVVIGGSFVLEQTTNSLGQPRTVLAISGGHVDLSPSLTGVLSGLEGALLVTSGGLA